MRYGFEIIDCEIPQSMISIEELSIAAGQGLDVAKKLRDNGLGYIPHNTGSTLDKMVNRIVLRNIGNENRGRIKKVLLAHSLPFLAPANIPFLDLCLHNSGLDDIVKIALSGQPCAILHQVLQLAMKWLSKETDGSSVLVIGADQAYAPHERIFFNTAMGDAVFLGIVSNRSDRNIILSSVTGTEIVACEGENTSQSAIDVFRANSPPRIRRCIEDALSAARITMGDVRYIVPHTPNRNIWDTMAKLLKIPREKILDDYIIDTGHFNSNDSFCHYIRACNEGRLQKDSIAVLVNPGFGGSCGCTIIKV